MEELRSTDALEKEIHEDARKKAQRLIEKADEVCAELIGNVDEKIQAAKEEALRLQKERIETYEKNITASDPLEKQRLRISIINKTLMASVNDYLSSLGDAKRSALLKARFEKILPLLKGKDFDARLIAGDSKDFRFFLSEKLSSHLSSFENASEKDILLHAEPLNDLNFHDGFLLLSTDNSLTIRLTLDEIIRELLDTHTAQLATTLYKGRLPQ